MPLKIKRTEVLTALNKTFDAMTKDSGDHPEDVLYAVSVAMRGIQEFVAALPAGVWATTPNK